MSKITVKRFLNKRLKPKIINENSFYPLYYTITYNRKTQNIKSLSNILMTEKGFDYLETNNELLYSDIEYINRDFSVKIENELYLIEKATDLIVNTLQYENVFSQNFTPNLKSYFSDLNEVLYKIGWRYYDQKIDNELEAIQDELNIDRKRLDNVYDSFKDKKNLYKDWLYNSLNQNQSLLNNIYIISKVTNIDFKQFFYGATLKFWYVIDLILLHHNKITRIEFINDFDYSEYKKINIKKKYPVSDKEIELISKTLKNKTIDIGLIK